MFGATEGLINLLDFLFHAAKVRLFFEIYKKNQRFLSEFYLDAIDIAITGRKHATEMHNEIDAH